MPASGAVRCVESCVRSADAGAFGGEYAAGLASRPQLGLAQLCARWRWKDVGHDLAASKPAQSEVSLGQCEEFLYVTRRSDQRTEIAEEPGKMRKWVSHPRRTGKDVIRRRRRKKGAFLGRLHCQGLMPGVSNLQEEPGHGRHGSAVWSAGASGRCPPKARISSR